MDTNTHMFSHSSAYTNKHAKHAILLVVSRYTHAHSSMNTHTHTHTHTHTYNTLPTCDIKNTNMRSNRPQTLLCFDREGSYAVIMGNHRNTLMSLLPAADCGMDPAGTVLECSTLSLWSRFYACSRRPCKGWNPGESPLSRILWAHSRRMNPTRIYSVGKSRLFCRQ